MATRPTPRKFDRSELVDRRFNTHHLRDAYASSDALMRYPMAGWIVFSLVVGVFYGLQPDSFILYNGIIYSVGLFFLYYMLLGFVRRKTDKYLPKLFVNEPLVWEKLRHDRKAAISFFDESANKPYDRSADPGLVRWVYSRWGRLGFIPKRGLAQALIVLSQYAVLGLYVVAFYRYAEKPLPTNFPVDLWKLHAVLTVAGLLIMVKNLSFLISHRHFVLFLEAAALLRGGELNFFGPQAFAPDALIAEIAEKNYSDVEPKRAADPDCCPKKEFPVYRFALEAVQNHPRFLAEKETLGPYEAVLAREILDRAKTKELVTNKDVCDYLDRRIPEILLTGTPPPITGK